VASGYGVIMSWPGDPESLLAGPRGRRLCWVLAEEMGRPGFGPAWEQVWSYSRGADPVELASELAAAVTRADWHFALAGMSEVALVGPLAESVTVAMYWQGPDAVDQALAHPQVAGELRPVAHAIIGAPGTQWWPTGIDAGTQQYVESPYGPDGRPAWAGAAGQLMTWLAATEEEERSAAGRPADPAAPYSGHWWSSPTWSGLVSTTRALPGLGPLQLYAMEDWPGWEDVRCWPVAVSHRAARIYEITSPDDWTALVTRYPLEVTKSRRHDWWRVTGWAGAWLMPDYTAAAADYDAIHLTVSGYLTTAGRALAVNDARCLLAGWDPDKTYWLADCVAGGGAPVRWIRDDSAHLGWRQAGPGL